MQKRPVVGLHDFYNSRPLLHPIRHGLIETPFTLAIDTPARLADRFHAGELDIALLPSIEYARSADAVIIPDLCIASLGEVETVILFSEMAIEDIETVLVDPKSRTSVAMLKILFREKFNRELVIVVGKEETPEETLRSADAGLLIGDAAFGIDPDRYLIHDLGALWYDYAGRPFVHALLCARAEKPWDEAVAALAEAKRVGLDHRDVVAHEDTAGIISHERLYEYLTRRILYDLNDEEIAGLAHFLGAAKRLGLCPDDTLRFYHPKGAQGA